MHALLLQKAFKKAEEDTGYNVPRRQAVFLSDQIFERSNQPFGERRLREFRNYILNGNPEKVELKGFVRDALTEYLGYSSYKEFLVKNEGKELPPNLGDEEKKRKGRRRRQIIISISSLFLLIISVFALYKFAPELFNEGKLSPKMMVWKGDHYEAVTLDLEKYGLKELKYYRQDLIDGFNKVTPDCTYEFFDSDGQELLWYGKNKKGELEYFSALARHPETGKTLKAITPYMIRKYICPTFRE